MWTSHRALACLIALCASPLGQAAVADYVYKGASFVIGDRKFDHKWHTKKSMPEKRSDMTATTIGDAIYLVGGCSLDQTWTPGDYPGYACGGGDALAITGSTMRYMPKSNTFDTTVSKAPRPRYRHAAAAVGAKLYLFGGTGADSQIVPEVDVLDTSTGKWTTLTKNMPNATTDLSAFAYEGKIYTMGGYDADFNALKLTQIFDPEKESWLKGPDMLEARGDMFAVVVDKQAFVLGGFTHTNNWKMPLDSMEMLDLGKAAAWSSRKAMGVARGDKAVASLNNILHVVGGETKNLKEHSVPLHDVEAYDPIGNAWYSGGEIPSKRFRFVAAAHGKSIFIFGGQGFLVGEHGADGSKYPLQSTVEEYSESVGTVAMTSKATGLLSRCLNYGLISATLSILLP